MPHLLLTNIHLREYGGSEMVSLEVAEEFILRGWKVDIYSLVVGAPFISEFEALSKEGLRVSDDPERFGDTDYDLIWVHHSLLPGSAIKRIRSLDLKPAFIWNHMSTFAELELPVTADIESRIADKILFVSPEARDTLQPFGLPGEKSELFQNPAPRSFITANLRSSTAHLKRVLLVSNHPPVELSGAVQLLSDQGIAVDTIGQGSPRRATPEALDRADAVITIGKTTQYALCLGKPVYQYDHFGGCGWITKENFDQEIYSNFSGRATRRKLGEQEIASELRNGYSAAQQFASANVAKHRKIFSLEHVIDGLITRLEQPSKVSLGPGDSMRLEAYSNILRSFYSTSLVQKHTKLLSAARAEALEEAQRLSTEINICDHLLLEKEAELQAANRSIDLLKNSKALKLGRILLSPLYRLNQLRKR